MGNNEILCFKNAIRLHGRLIVKTALDMTTQDIKFNRIGFNKRTSKSEFMKIFFRSLDLAVRV